MVWRGKKPEVSTIAGRSAAVGGVAVAHPQLHAQIQATFAALAARAIDRWIATSRAHRGHAAA